jgi:retron-type reverse transcriptase
VASALARIREVARQRKKERFTSLFHHISLSLLRLAFHALKRDAASGVDGLTWKDYEADLERKLESLHAQVQRGAYRALPSRRQYIPKPDGRQRPIAIAALEDKIVQKAVLAVLNAIYENDFLGISYGFRTGRSQHDALDALIVGITSKKVSYIFDADIRSFFRFGQSGMACSFHRAPDQGPAHDSPDPKMAQGGCPRRWSRKGQ